MSIFVTEELIGKNRYRLEAYIDEKSGHASYSSKDLEGLRFESFPKLIEAIKKKELDEKKAFKNPTAYMLPGYPYADASDTVRQVTVTSLRDESHAWVTGPNGKRGVERLSNLYTKKNQLESYVKLKKATQNALTDAHNALEGWRPQR